MTDGTYRITAKTSRLALTALTKVKPGNSVPMQPFSGEDGNAGSSPLPDLKPLRNPSEVMKLNVLVESAATELQ